MRGCGRTPLASFRKIQGLPISKIVRTADSRQIIIITNFTLQLAPTKFFKGRRERGHEGAWGTPKAPAAAPPLAKILDPPLVLVSTCMHSLG